MRFISTKVHGTLDYISGLLVIVSPWLFGFADGTAAQWVPVTVGVILLLSSIITNYEAGVIKVISMPTHLGLDIVAGLLLLASPWLFGFAGRITWPHVLFGLFEIAAGLTTKRNSYTDRILA